MSNNQLFQGLGVGEPCSVTFPVVKILSPWTISSYHHDVNWLAKFNNQFFEAGTVATKHYSFYPYNVIVAGHGDFRFTKTFLARDCIQGCLKYMILDLYIWSFEIQTLAMYQLLT